MLNKLEINFIKHLLLFDSIYVSAVYMYFIMYRQEVIISNPLNRFTSIRIFPEEKPVSK